MSLSIVVSAVVMGSFLAVVAALLAVGGKRRTAPEPQARPDRAVPVGRLADARIWVFGFILVALTLSIAVLEFVGAGFTSLSAGGAGVLIGGLVGGLLLAFLLGGSYISARGYGFASAGAAMISAWAVGLLLLVGVVVQLVAG